MALAADLKTKFPNIIVDAATTHGDESVVIKREGVRDLMTHLRNDAALDFSMLMDLSCVDYLFWPEKAVRFEVVYQLYSVAKKHRLLVKAPVPETDAVIDSVTSIWPAANWLEREAYDMFGVKFSGHPDLRRILMYTGFDGHPLRKDYPFNKRQPQIGPDN